MIVVVQKGTSSLVDVAPAVASYFSPDNFNLAVSELIKDIKKWMLNYFTTPVGPIKGINDITISQPSFITQGYAQLLIT